MYKERTEGDESNQEKFYESVFLDVTMCRFVDVWKSIRDKIPILKNVSEFWSGFLL